MYNVESWLRHLAYSTVQKVRVMFLMILKICCSKHGFNNFEGICLNVTFFVHNNIVIYVFIKITFINYKLSVLD